MCNVQKNSVSQQNNISAVCGMCVCASDSLILNSVAVRCGIIEQFRGYSPHWRCLCVKSLALKIIIYVYESIFSLFCFNSLSIHLYSVRSRSCVYFQRNGCKPAANPIQMRTTAFATCSRECFQRLPKVIIKHQQP